MHNSITKNFDIDVIKIKKLKFKRLKLENF